MLGHWRSMEEYQRFVLGELISIALTDLNFVLEYKSSIEKLWIFNTDRIKYITESCYSFTGRPSTNQPELYRAYVLMQSLDLTLSKFHTKLTLNPVIRTSCGFSHDDIPSIGAFYTFVDRLIKIDDKTRVKIFKNKPKAKYGKGEKMPPKHKGVVDRLVDKAIAGRNFPHRPELVLQRVFAVVVEQSVQNGLIPNSLIASGAGTCNITGASPYGKKICKCSQNGNYKCDCARKFSDPNATWGWDSHNERYFYGYTGYFISTYNKDYKLDLPLYLRIVDAKRHDSISAVVALMEFRELYPRLSLEVFVSDSASDNYATYRLLDHIGTKGVIALNKTKFRKKKYPGISGLDKNGAPLCPAGHPMVNYGFCGKDRCRIKWRCPRACGKVEKSEFCDSCSPSPYGRVCYTKPQWDPRLFTKIPRGSAKWKSIMKQRTACERVNNRILNDYGLEKSKVRGKKRYAFYAMIAGINIHLDAQLKKLHTDGAFNFEDTFGITSAA